MTQRPAEGESLDPSRLARADTNATGLRLPKGQRYTLYGVSIGVWITGAVWLVYHYFMQTEGPFGFQKHPMEVISLEVHGAFAMASLWIFGTLGWTHVLRGWRSNWRRWTGGIMVAVVAILIVTGWGLYYFVKRDWREWTSLAHWSVGLAALAFFLVHWLSRSQPGRTS